MLEGGLAKFGQKVAMPDVDECVAHNICGVLRYSVDVFKFSSFIYPQKKNGIHVQNMQVWDICIRVPWWFAAPIDPCSKFPPLTPHPPTGPGV